MVIGYLLKQHRLARGMDQQTLCQGICAKSYLSKIEHGQANAGEDILRLLFARVGVADWSPRPADPSAETLLRDFFEAELLGEDASALKDKAASLTPHLQGTELELSARIAALYMASTEAEAAPLLEALTPYTSWLTPAQTMLVAHIRWQNMGKEGLQVLTEAEQAYPCCITANDLALHHFVAGRWQEALQWCRTAFDRAVQAGCVHYMMEASLTEGGCYANLYNVPLMRAAYARTAALARGNDRVLADIAYNIGATLLEVGRDRDALPELLCAEKTYREDSSRLLVCHKLALCLQRLHRKQEGERYLQEAEQLAAGMQDEGWRLMVALVRRRYAPGWLDDPAYGAMLRRFCAGEEFPRGYVVFHERLLEEWLTYHRQYKEAYEQVCRRFPDII